MHDSHRRWLGGFVCAAVLVSTDAGAQQPLNRLTVSGSLSFGSFWSDESRLGGGPIFGGAVRYQPWERWGFELNLRRYTYERHFDSGVVFAGHGVELTGDVAYYLRTSGARPFINMGIGILRREGENRSPIRDMRRARSVTLGPPPIIGEQVHHSRSTDTGLSVGGGVDIPLGSGWSVRPEVRSLWGAGGVLSPLDVGTSVAFGW